MACMQSRLAALRTSPIWSKYVNKKVNLRKYAVELYVLAYLCRMKFFWKYSCFKTDAA